MNDEQAMALLKKCQLSVAWQPSLGMWWVRALPPAKAESYASDLNVAIADCAQKLGSPTGD